MRYLVGLPQVDVNHKDKIGYTSLLAAVETAGADVVELLIDAGADIEVKHNNGRSPILVASDFGDLQVVEVLVKAGADVCVTENFGDTCLTLAAANGHTETVRTLLCMPEVDVNQSNNRGNTALHYAVAQKHSVVQLLIDAGADVEAQNRLGRAPLHCACEIGELDIVQMLVEAGVDVCVGDDDDSTAYLIVATFYGHIESVRYLVGLREVDVNHRDFLGRTALHHARQRQHADVVQVLLKHGAEE